MDIWTMVLVFSALFLGVIIGMILETVAIIILVKLSNDFAKGQEAKKNG